MLVVIPVFIQIFDSQMYFQLNHRDGSGVQVVIFFDVQFNILK